MQIGHWTEDLRRACWIEFYFKEICKIFVLTFTKIINSQAATPRILLKPNAGNEFSGVTISV